MSVPNNVSRLAAFFLSEHTHLIMGLLAELKLQTAACHQALETEMDLTNQLKAVPDYIRLLEQFYTLYHPLEASLEKSTPWQAHGWNFADRRKTPWLEQDLRHFGYSEAQLQSLPKAGDLPPLHSEGAALGCLYVLEGSTLGGQFITRMVQKNLAVTPETGGAFFSGYGSETPARWKEFGEWAEQRSGKISGCESAAVDAARSTFNCFSEWFKKEASK